METIKQLIKKYRKELEGIYSFASLEPSQYETDVYSQHRVVILTNVIADLEEALTND